MEEDEHLEISVMMVMAREVAKALGTLTSWLKAKSWIHYDADLSRQCFTALRTRDS